MHKSLINLQLQCLFLICSWLACRTGTCSAQQRSETEPSDAHKHGQAEILSQQLIRDRQLELLFRSAETAQENGDAGSLRESLLAIFSHEFDVFEFNSDAEIANSVRSRAMTLLLQSSGQMQRAWLDGNNALAEQELETAIRNGDRLAVARVARKFPFTEAGLQAHVVRLASMLLKGDTSQVANQVRQLEETYAGTLLESQLERQLRALKEHVAELNRNRDASDDASRVTELSISTAGVEGTVSPPWPKPLWMWTEKIWSFPGAPQNETGSLLSGFEPESENRIDAFNNWRPVFWNDKIVFRTPLRIVGLDRSTGVERWSIPTDTFERQRDSTYDELESEEERQSPQRQYYPAHILPICGMAEFGLLSADADFMFFVDRFAFLTDSDPLADNPLGRIIRNRNGFNVIEDDEHSIRTAVASRLIAIHRSDRDSVPGIAWQIGDGQPFQYRPVVKVDAIPFEPEPQSSVAVEASTNSGASSLTEDSTQDKTWAGHRFLSPPTGQESQLFVLTLNETQVFLNCLQRNTGELLWRQPILFIDENAVSFIDTSLFAKRTSTCIVAGDTVVCSLADGILIGVRATDGALLWATAIRELPSELPRARFGSPVVPEESAITSPSILVPCISEEIVVCCNHASPWLYGLSLQNGEILWKSSRRAFGAGDVGGSPDYYIAGICGDQVILIGDRHCRSVGLKSGEQNWVVQIPASSGRGECRGDRCVIPVREGQALLVNLSNGTLIAPSFVDSPKGSIDQYGAISSDDELMSVATPTSIVVYPRVDALLNTADQLPALAANPTRQILIQAQAHLINGDVDSSLALLKDAVSSRMSDDAPIPQIDEFLAELILKQWGSRIADAREALVHQVPVHGTKTVNTGSAAELIPADAALLSKLNLPSDVRFRIAAFQLLCDSTADQQQPELHELQQRREWQQLIRLSNLWSVRPEILFDAPVSNPFPVERRLDEFSIEELRRLADHVLRHPHVITDAASRQRLIGQLVRHGEIAFAEVLLISWHQVASDLRDANDADRPDVVVTGSDESSLQLLNQIRSADFGIPNVSQAAGLTSEVFEPLSFELQAVLRNLDTDFETLRRYTAVDFLPAQRETELYLSIESESNGKLLTIDTTDGSTRDEVVLPFSIDRVTGAYSPLSSGVQTPGLFPVCGTDEMAMMSCPLAGKARALWTKKFRNGEKEARHVEFGALGADHFVWQFADTLHCADPLTGEDLWTRQLTLSNSDQAILHRAVSPSVRRIAGDRIATLVMGSDSRSYECFSTRDGRRLSSGRLPIGRSESVVAVGRCLLYTDSNARLHLFDSATGNDELEDDEPISPLNRDDRTVCQVLENNRVLVVSATMELILIDVDRGRVVFRTPASKYVSSGFVYSFSAFERHGRLFAALSSEGRSGRSIQQAFMRGAPYLSNGPLMSLDPLSGEVHWSVNVEQGIFPDIQGDPTDLLVSWSSPEPDLEAHMGFEPEDKLIVQVFDETTGQLIARSPVYSSLPPVRCVHLAEEGVFRLTTPNATISIRAPAAE